MAVQFVTSGRFEADLGRLGIDKIMAFHKVAAWWVLIAPSCTRCFYVLPTWLDDPCAGERLIAYLTLPHYRSGVVALGALALLVLTSACATVCRSATRSGAQPHRPWHHWPPAPGCTMR
jgi:hypothetical protein